MIFCIRTWFCSVRYKTPQNRQQEKTNANIQRIEGFIHHRRFQQYIVDGYDQKGQTDDKHIDGPLMQQRT